jgi:glycosyltransferase involved in cell wall biosynthesis
VHVLVQPAAATFAREGLGVPAERVHVTPTRRTTPTSICEWTALGVPALRRGLDVVHGTKHLLPLRTGSVTLLTVHDMILVERPHEFGPLKRHLLRAPYLASIRRADGIVAVSAATAGRVASHVPAVAARTAAVPLAVSSSLLAAPARRIAGVDPSQAALVVADLSPRKNLRLLLDCWPQVRSGRHGATLLVVGPRPGPGSPLAEALTRAERGGGVAHLGRVSDGELRWLYENVGATLCPSEAEGFGLPALEALAFDSPLLVSSDPALVEAAGGRATVVPAGDAGAWCAAVSAALRQPRRPAAPSPARSWDDVADGTVTAARVALAARARTDTRGAIRPSASPGDVVPTRPRRHAGGSRAAPG